MGESVPPARDTAPTASDADDRTAVAELLGRQPSSQFCVVVRHADGSPMVIRNHPLMDDGRPMPTLYWLVDRELNRRIGTLEAEGGVRRSESEVDAGALAAAHDRYATERDAEIPADWSGPRPFGGVGGTRNGVKCLHTHYAWFLAGGDDPVGSWVHDALSGSEPDGEPGTESGERPGRPPGEDGEDDR